MADPILELKNLATHFPVSRGFLVKRQTGTVKAVDGVNLTLGRGEVLGLVGESGCGKSTLARTIMQLVPASTGMVVLSGRPLSIADGVTHDELSRELQMVFQDPYASLNPRMRVVDIIGRPLTIFYGVKGRKKVERVGELLELVGLNADQLLRYPHEFSGGQRQRIGIARALAANPKLIIADEPVSSLDVSVQAQVLNLLRKLQRELQLTMIFISHDLNVVSYLADIVGVMYAGKMMEIAPADTIFKHPLHPYTKALLAANPTVGAFMESLPAPLPGEISLPVNPPAACRLEPRCPIRVEKCAAIEPILIAKQGDHWVACHEVD
jgi:oligopeptide/dipeptide ABC transporter ATP-binding protein